MFRPLTPSPHGALFFKLLEYSDVAPRSNRLVIKLCAMTCLMVRN